MSLEWCQAIVLDAPLLPKIFMLLHVELQMTTFLVNPFIPKLIMFIWLQAYNLTDIDHMMMIICIFMLQRNPLQRIGKADTIVMHTSPLSMYLDVSAIIMHTSLLSNLFDVCCSVSMFYTNFFTSAEHNKKEIIYNLGV
ncbi:hypothetical protein ACJX0J_029872, partial [Zea mays]